MTEQQKAPEQEHGAATQECCELYGEYCYPCQATESAEKYGETH